MIEAIKQEIQQLGSPQKAAFLSYYFKTGKGQYAEGDIFLGLTMPENRAIAKKYSAILTLPEIESLLHEPIHEYRMIALTLLVDRFKKSKNNARTEIFELYLNNLQYVNNWDLVDTSCSKIVGAYLFDKDRDILYELAQRPHLWSQRVAIVSTWYFIQKNQIIDTFNIAEMLLSHPHDLIHKAVGWMLREVGKRDEAVLEDFLQAHIRQIPRTTLRYSIEKFEESKRKHYLKL